MEISQKLLCFLFLASFATGAFLGIIYDLLTLIRLLAGLSPVAPKVSAERFKRACGLALLFLGDLCFMLLCGVTLVLLLYFINDGGFRFLAPLGMSCGLFVYRVTLGRLVLSLSETLVKCLRYVIRVVARAIWKPLYACLCLGYRLVICPIGDLIRQRLDRRLIKQTKRMIEDYVKEAEQTFIAEK